MPDRFRDPVRNAQLRRREIHVVGDEERARSDRDDPAARMDLGRTKVRGPLGLADLPGEPLEFPLADLRQVPPQFGGGGFFVEVDRQLEAGSDLLADAARESDAVLHCRPAHRNERNHVHRSHPRVLPFMGAQIDEGEGTVEQGHRRVEQSLLGAGQGQDGPVVVAVGGEVEDTDAWPGTDRADDLFDHLLPASFAEIRNRFDDPLHGSVPRSSAR